MPIDRIDRDQRNSKRTFKSGRRAHDNPRFIPKSKFVFFRFVEQKDNISPQYSLAKTQAAKTQGNAETQGNADETQGNADETIAETRRRIRAN